MSTERTWVGPSAPERLNILRNTESIAIVGMSNKPARASYFVATYLLSSSPYRVYFVNPVLDEVLGQKVYPSLADLPEVPDMVDAFRKDADLPGVAQEAVDLGAKTVWMQLGSWSEEAAAIAENACTPWSPRTRSRTASPRAGNARPWCCGWAESGSQP